MKIPSFVWYAGMALAIAISAFAVTRDLSKDASPAAQVCASAPQGATCTVDPAAYDARVIAVEQNGSQAVYLVVSQGSKVVTVIPLE